MNINQLNKKQFFLSIVVAAVFLFEHPATAKEFEPINSNNDIEITQGGTFVLQALLNEMGLKLPDKDKKIDPPAPTPAPAPTPQPEKQDEGFFDDDFFDGNKGFDQVVDGMDKNFEKTVKRWDEEYEKTLAKWEKASKIYDKTKDKYIKAVFHKDKLLSTSSQTSNVKNKALAYKVNINELKPGDYHVIPGAFNLPIKSQGKRGTCGAFSGVRAIETLLAQHNINTDLSEQHFYFISKPNCQTRPCDASEDGSTLDGGFVASSLSALVPESSCPYVPESNGKNITFAPLNGCNKTGVVKAGKFFFNNNKDLNAVLNNLRNNIPVNAGFTLTKSYYKNEGLVKYYDPINTSATNSMHDGGHGNLLVGYIKLPESLSSEGSYCMITVNSWTDGWGRGGYACLTEKWLEKNAIEFVSLTSVILTEKGKEIYSVE